MFSRSGRNNRGGQVFDENGQDMPNPNLLSPNSSMKSLDVSSASDNESWASEDSYPEELSPRYNVVLDSWDQTIKYVGNLLQEGA